MSESVAVSLSRVSHSFGPSLALDDIHLELRAARRHALMGTNGSGKSTLLRIIAGLLMPSSGVAMCLGFDLSRRRTRALARAVALVSQDFSLYKDLTIEENLGLVRDLYTLEDPERAMDGAIAAFNLAHCRRIRAAAVSVGTRQRLMLAAAFMRAPPLLLLDEPTAALDEASRAALWLRIDAAQAAGATVVLTTHHEQDLVSCDSVTRLDAGRLVSHESRD